MLKENSVYILKNCLLNRKPTSHLLRGSDSLVYSVNKRAEVIADPL